MFSLLQQLILLGDDEFWKEVVMSYRKALSGQNAEDSDSNLAKILLGHCHSTPLMWH
jgi:hypothetical protein